LHASRLVDLREVFVLAQGDVAGSAEHEALRVPLYELKRLA